MGTLKKLSLYVLVEATVLLLVVLQTFVSDRYSMIKLVVLMDTLKKAKSICTC